MKNKEKHQNFDCCVVGGGMIGAAMALGLAQQGHSVALIEHKSLEHFDPQQAPDMRLSALNMHSVNLLKSLGAWPHVLNMRCRPYSSLSVWDAQGLAVLDTLGKTSFSAKEVGSDLLGYFVENRIIQLGLYQEIQSRYKKQVSCFFDLPITSINAQDGKVRLQNDTILSASLLLGSDGAQSQVRREAGIACKGWQYSQQANSILIRTSQTLADETWQAFYESGPRALLPMYDNYASLVWYDNKKQSDWLKHAELSQVKQAVIDHFSLNFEDFEVLKLAGFPLTRMHANKYGEGKAIILGDAAHTINPLAGQGVNLGYKDVSALLEIISENGLNSAQTICKAYERKRYHQNQLMMSSLDILYKAFSSQLSPIRMLRKIGLSVADKSGPIKIQTLKYAMGLY